MTLNSGMNLKIVNHCSDSCRRMRKRIFQTKIPIIFQFYKVNNALSMLTAIHHCCIKATICSFIVIIVHNILYICIYIFIWYLFIQNVMHCDVTCQLCRRRAPAATTGWKGERGSKRDWGGAIWVVPLINLAA